MPYIDMREHQEAFGMVQTVRKRFEWFTRKEVKKSILARKLQAMLGHPSDQELTQMVSRLSLWKSPKSCVTPTAITHARTIFGKNCAGLRRKSVRVKPARVEIDVVGIP